VTKDCLWSL